MISDITGSEKVLSDACATRWGKRQRAARSNNEKSLTTPSYVWRHRQDVVETQPAAHKCTTVSRDPHEEGFDPGPCGAMVRTVFGNAPLLLKILPDRSSLLTPAPASSSSLRQSAWPFLAAVNTVKIGETPLLLHLLTSPLASSSSLRQSAWPYRAAAQIGD